MNAHHQSCGFAKVITGFNTDIEHNGVTYHVQTEDKGLGSPLILSLIYLGGAILASKRTSYDDLIASGFDETALAERLHRQHKLICAAIYAGRIEDLRRMNNKDSGAARTGTDAASTDETEIVSAPKDTIETNVLPALVNPVTVDPAVHDSASLAATDKKNGIASLPEPSAITHTVRVVKDGVADFVRTEAATSLYLSLLGEHEFQAGTNIDLLIRLSRHSDGSEQVADAAVKVKLLGTNFWPLMFDLKTDDDGIAHVMLALPEFKHGRAALVITATVDGYETELRRIVKAI